MKEKKEKMADIKRDLAEFHFGARGVPFEPAHAAKAANTPIIVAELTW